VNWRMALHSILTWIVAGIGVLCCPSTSAAHLVTTGMGPVCDGIGHLLLTPEDLVPVLALAFFAGLRGAVAGRRTMFLLPAAWFVGGLAGSVMNTATAVPIPAVSFLILGGLVAADLSLPPSAVTGLAIVLGLVHGFLNGCFTRGRYTRSDRDHDSTVRHSHSGFGPCRLA
jgi:hydrogenase/urease accessory protein HupE